MRALASVSILLQTILPCRRSPATTGTTSELTFQYTGPVVEAKKEVEGVDPSVVEVEVKVEVKEEESGGEE